MTMASICGRDCGCSLPHGPPPSMVSYGKRAHQSCSQCERDVDPQSRRRCAAQSSFKKQLATQLRGVC